MKNIYRNQILVIDFGSQYTQLIIKSIRKIGVYCEIKKWDISKKEIIEIKPNGIILSGGPESALDKNSPKIDDFIFSLKIPILGICYGMHIMTTQLGGKVINSKKSEFGYSKVEIYDKCLLIDNISDGINEKKNSFLNTWMSHCDEVKILPKGFKSVAKTSNCNFSVIFNKKKNFFGVQFHPEVTHTTKGLSILERFVINICMCKKLWIPSNITKSLIKFLKEKIQKDKVILGISGGIDSTVTAILLKKAIDKKLICIFIDNGLLRINEPQKIINILNNYLNLNVIYINARKRFFNALKKISDPEKKRKIIGKIFIDIFSEESSKMNCIKWLAQGTIYPDVIESSHAKNKFIKSHHNVGGLPKNINFHLIEPLKNLFKDEVFQIAMELKIPKVISFRHPFPGPGLAVRIIGEVKKQYCNLLKKADSIFIEELQKANLYNKISQAFCVFLPLRTVSIMGDNRKYGWIICLRAVQTNDFMTAQSVHFSYEFLQIVSNRIINEINEISRVVYDISSKPPSTIEWE